MKFATIGHLDNKKRINQLPKNWIQEKYIISPEYTINNTSGYFLILKLTAEEIMTLPEEKVRQDILNASLFVQRNLGVNLIQLGGLTTSITKGGVWLANQQEYHGYINHGDSFTAAVTCQTVKKVLKLWNKTPSETTLAIVGAYGIIGEAVSKILVPEFSHTILIGRRKQKLEELQEKLDGTFSTSTELDTQQADLIITATSHPKALLHGSHLKKNAIVVDVSQPPNLGLEVCQKRTDICRIDGGYVDFAKGFQISIPGIPKGKLFACIVEVIMQAMENEQKNHVGSIDMNHLYTTEQWAQKYGFRVHELTNFGQEIENK